MSRSRSVKIVCVGQERGGKTTFCDYIGSFRETPGAYKPTIGVQIHELERVVEVKGEGECSVAVQLWDCSGQKSFDACWDAIVHKADGIMIVFPCERGVEKEVEFWFTKFAKGMQAEQCLLLANTGNTAEGKATEKFRFGKKMQNVELVVGDIGEKLMATFDRCVGNVVMCQQAREDAVLGGK